jgi:hypothetical protein
MEIDKLARSNSMFVAGHRTVGMVIQTYSYKILQVLFKVVLGLVSEWVMCVCATHLDLFTIQLQRQHIESVQKESHDH